MRKTVSLAAIMVMFLIASVSSHAGDLIINGHVTDMYGNGIAGAEVECHFLDETVTIFTDASGAYEVEYHNYCGYKLFVISAAGYFTRNYDVRDDSCCDCCGYAYPDCCIPPNNPGNTCAPVMTQDFMLLCFDGDHDGVCNSLDNCPNTPNGIELGTCQGGSEGGKTCTDDRHCKGCAAYCSKDQEDSDGDGIGDVCDNAPFQAAANVGSQSFNPGFMTYETRWTILGLVVAWYCEMEGCDDHECFGQLVEDIFNGPENFLGKPTRPEPLPLTYDCPDRVTIGEIYLLIRDALFDIFYGDRFPDEE